MDTTALFFVGIGLIACFVFLAPVAPYVWRAWKTAAHNRRMQQEWEAEAYARFNDFYFHGKRPPPGMELVVDGVVMHDPPDVELNWWPPTPPPTIH